MTLIPNRQQQENNKHFDELLRELKEKSLCLYRLSKLVKEHVNNGNLTLSDNEQKVLDGVDITIKKYFKATDCLR